MTQDLRLYLRLLTYLKPYRFRLAAAIVAMLAFSGITALLAYLVKPVLDEVFFVRRAKMLYLLPPLIILLYLVKGALAYAHRYYMSFIGNGMVARMRDELFCSLQRQPLAFFDTNATGDLMSRLTYDVNLLQTSVTGVATSFFKDGFTIVGLTAVIFYREWRLALISIAVFPLARPAAASPSWTVLWTWLRPLMGAYSIKRAARKEKKVPGLECPRITL